MKIVVGLGNPGPEYAGTRHNFGAMVVEALAEAHGLSFKNTRFKGEGSVWEQGGRKVLLFKPTTFMNLSGEAVSRALHFYKVPPSSLLVLHDDLDLPLGRMKFSASGSSGGQKGVESIIDSLQTREFDRLRLGIGRPEGLSGADYVLSAFNAGEKDLVLQVQKTALEALRCYLDEGIAKAMNRFHGAMKE